MTRRSGRSDISARAIAPEPVPTSWTRAPSGSLGADLDQQLGLAARPEHALVDGDLELAEGRAAEDVGHRLAVDPARHPLLDRRRDLGAGPRRRSRPRAPPASTPSASATSTSASARASSTPAAAIRSAAVVEHSADGAGRRALLTLNVYSRHYPPSLPRLTAPKFLRKTNIDSHSSARSVPQAARRIVRRRAANASVAAHHDSDPDRSGDHHRQALELRRGQPERARRRCGAGTRPGSARPRRRRGRARRGPRRGPGRAAARAARRRGPSPASRRSASGGRSRSVGTVPSG